MLYALRYYACMYAETMNALHNRRLSLGWTQHMVADKCGLTQSEISKYERLRVPVPGPVLAQWAEALGLRIELLAA